MEEYIPKSAVVAEIEKFIERAKAERVLHPKTILAAKNYLLIEDYNKLLSIIDTLEVKEVDLETKIKDYIDSHFTEDCGGGMLSDWYKVFGGVHYKDLVEIAKHFFELGLSASNPITAADRCIA